MKNTVIIGSGPAALSAAVYTARGGLEPLVIASSVESGGALINTTDVDNFPGFDEGIQGPDLMAKMENQAKRFGAEILYEDATELDIEGPIKKITLSSGKIIEAKTVIYATGSAYRKIGIDREVELTGHGLSSCATCDGFFFSGQTIAVVGGGDSAMEEALFLTKFAEKVFVIHRREELRASKVMVDRAMANEKIDFIFNAEVVELKGETELEGVVLKDTLTGHTSNLPVTGLFVAIGSDPRVHLVHGKVDFTDAGVIKVDGRSSRTSVPGVFAAGDVIDSVYKQAGVAAGAGIVAALDAEAYLASL